MSRGNRQIPCKTRPDKSYDIVFGRLRFEPQLLIVSVVLSRSPHQRSDSEFIDSSVTIVF